MGRRPGGSAESSAPRRGRGLAARGVLAVLALALAVIPPAEVAAAGDAAWCHRVRPGDTLFGIARRYGTTVSALRGLNRLEGSTLPVGLVLTLPGLASLERGRLELDTAPLRATRGNLRRENMAADQENLSRLSGLEAVRRFVRLKLLVPLPAEAPTYWVSGVSQALRVARPWTKRFIEQLAEAHHRLFGGKLKVTSLTRTAGTQAALRKTNGNAAPATGAIRSTHLTGASVDISTRSLSRPAVAWLRHVLRALADRRLLHAIEEFQQPHVHVLVFKRYLAYARGLGSAVLMGGC